MDGAERRSQVLHHRMLSDEEIGRIAPSVFATGPSARVSARYGFVSTADVLHGLRQNNWGVTSVQVSRVREAGERPFARHFLRLRREGEALLRTVGDSVPEVVVVNDHRGGSKFLLLAGVYRLVCSNGMVVGCDAFSSRIRHLIHNVEGVVEEAERISHKMGDLADLVGAFRDLSLDREQRVAFAEQALALRYPAPGSAPIDGADLLRPRRWQDEGANLWTTLNVVQENLVRGGIATGRTGHRQRRATLALRGAQREFALNADLWQLAESTLRAA